MARETALNKELTKTGYSINEITKPMKGLEHQNILVQGRGSKRARNAKKVALRRTDEARREIQECYFDPTKHLTQYVSSPSNIVLDVKANRKSDAQLALPIDVNDGEAGHGSLVMRLPNAHGRKRPAASEHSETPASKIVWKGKSIPFTEEQFHTPNVKNHR